MKSSFSDLALVLEKKKPTTPILFEFILGKEVIKSVLKEEYKEETPLAYAISVVKAFQQLGYGYAPILLHGAEFPRTLEQEKTLLTKSMNTTGLITNWDSFHAYPWPSASNVDYSWLLEGAKALHPGNKLMVYSYDGILENAIGIVGYETLCLMLYDDYPLVEAIFQKIGSILYEYYEKCLEYDTVGLIMCNDDWGFNTQTMLPPSHLRTLVFPWYQKIVALAHKKGCYAILHSCGALHQVEEDILSIMQFDGKHSFEDNIEPIEEAYKRLQGRIALLGGIDVDFMVQKTEEEIYERAKNLVHFTQGVGYALGTGNSVPDYVPFAHYLAMIHAIKQEETCIP